MRLILSALIVLTLATTAEARCRGGLFHRPRGHNGGCNQLPTTAAVATTCATATTTTAPTATLPMPMQFVPVNAGGGCFGGCGR